MIHSIIWLSDITKQKKYIRILILLLVTLSIFQPNPVFSQSISSTVNDGFFSSLGSAVSQLVSGDNTVHFENPQNYFPPQEHPSFTLIAPAAQDINAKVIRKSLNEEVVLKVEKQDEGKYVISFAEPFVILDNYSLDVVARESFFYNRHLVLDFAWGEVKPEEQAQTSWLKSFLEERPEYKNLPVVKKDATSVHFKKPDGTIEANFTQSPINYRDNKGEWQSIDTTLKPVDSTDTVVIPLRAETPEGTTEFTGSGTPAIIASDGTVKVKDSTHSQKTTRFGYFDPASQAFTLLESLPEGTIQDNKYIRETNWRG